MSTHADEDRVEKEIARVPFVTGILTSADARTVLVESSREVPEWALERAIRVATEPAPQPVAHPRPSVASPAATSAAPGGRARTPRTHPSAPPAEPTAVPDGDTLTTVIPVLGMTCRSCEVRIEKYVSKLPSVQRVSASAPRGRVVIESTKELSSRAVTRAIAAAGYEIGQSPWLARDRTVWIEVGLSLIVVLGIAFIAQISGITEIASGAGDLARGGLVVALVLGLAAGFSTCMALVGGLVMALSASFQASQAASGIAAMRPTLVFLGGRIAGYGLFGAILGAIGGSVAMPPIVTALLMVVVAIVMTLLGARLTGVSPRVAGWSPTLPMGLGRRLGVADGDGIVYSGGRALGLGAATFFLPCGFTQAVQVFALSTGSPVFAGALLATFAIGTAPALMAVAGLPAVVPAASRPTLLRFVGVAVLGFAVVNGTAGLRLAGIPLPSFGIGTAVAANLPASVGADGVQELATYQEANGYGPSNAAIYANIPTRWTIDSRSSASCAKFLVIPALSRSVTLQPGANTIDLPPMAAGRLDYSCAMGMFGGSIRIVDAPLPSAAPDTGSR